eukprot:2551624-Amphidinium_carterae.1
MRSLLLTLKERQQTALAQHVGAVENGTPPKSEATHIRRMICNHEVSASVATCKGCGQNYSCPQRRHSTPSHGRWGEAIAPAARQVCLLKTRGEFCLHLSFDVSCSAGCRANAARTAISMAKSRIDKVALCCNAILSVRRVGDKRKRGKSVHRRGAEVHLQICPHLTGC